MDIESNWNGAFHESVQVAHLRSIFFCEIFNLITPFLDFHLKGWSWNVLDYFLLLKIKVLIKLGILI
jgi:hypothetical protein